MNYDTSSPHFGAGTRLQYQGRFKEALAAFEAWLVKEPKNTVAWNCKGIALHGLTKYDEAIQCFGEALKILPDDPPTTGNMGRTFHAKGDYQRAADWLEKSLAALPAAEYWSLKGDCLLRLGQPEAALGCFRSARDLDSTKAEYWSNEGAIHAQLGSLSDALQCYQKAIDAEGNCAAAWFNKADVEERLGRMEAAKGSLEKFIQLSPAGMKRQIESAHKRIQEFAKPNANTNEGNRALKKSACNGDLVHVKAFIAAGEDVNAEDKDGWSALMLASHGGHLDCAKAIIAAGANLNAKDPSGKTALHKAAYNGHADCVKALVTVHADVNAKDQYGLTPLMNAVFAGNVDCVNTLIAAGADLDVKDHAGMTALRLATGKGLDADCVKVLIAAGATQ